MTFNRFLSFFIFLWIPLTCFAKVQPIGDLLAQGRTEMLEFRLTQAESTLKLALRRSEGAQSVAAIHYHLTSISCWKAFFEQTDTANQAFQNDSEDFLRALRNLKDDQWQPYFRAELHFQRTLLFFQKGKLNDAALEAKKAYDNYESVIEKYPNFADAYKGFGMLKVAIGSMPRSYRWMLSILGYSGSTKEGLQMMRKAATEGTFAPEEAQIYYAVADMSMNEMMDKAAEKLPALYQRFPQSPLIMAVYGFALIQQQKTADALHVLSQPTNTDVYRPALIAYFTAESLFRQNRFEEAIPAYQSFLQQFEGSIYKSNALLRLGLAFEMLSNREEALKAFLQIQNDSDFDSDRMAKRWAAHYAATPLSQTEQNLLKAQNHFDSGEWEKAIELCKSILSDDSIHETYRSEAAYRTGRALQKSGKLNEAIDAYAYSVAHRGDMQAKFAPWSQYYIGECYEELGDNANARRSYRKSLAFNGNFDYHKSLEQRAQAALSRL